MVWVFDAYLCGLHLPPESQILVLSDFPFHSLDAGEIAKQFVSPGCLCFNHGHSICFGLVCLHFPFGVIAGLHNSSYVCLFTAGRINETFGVIAV